MAAEIEALPFSKNTKRMEGSLMAKRVEKHVPNHLAETRIFTQVEHGRLQCRPSVIHFKGYKVGKLHQQTLRIINASKDNQRMHIIPPTNSSFTIKYSKQMSNLVPGLSLNVTVQFKPAEWKYYYDCIRVHGEGNENFLIPIHAYPVINTADLPQSVTFLPTPIGQSKSKTISLKCDVPVDFEYELSLLESHPAFSVTPMKGTVSANSQVDIKVTFEPSNFSTACMKLQLKLSQFNSTPHVCTFYGSSTPGLSIEQNDTKTADQMPYSTSSHKTKATATLPHMSHSGVNRTKNKIGLSATLATRVEEDIVCDGIHFPPNLDTPSAISKVLSQKPGQMKASKLKQVLFSEQKDGLPPNRQLKEAAFLQKVREIADKERANQLRWVTSLGSVPMLEADKELVLQSRREQLITYQQNHNIALQNDQELNKPSTRTVCKRTRRQVNQTPSYQPQFDPYTNNIWTRRHLAIQRFVQVARKVVIQLRYQTRLNKLLASEKANMSEKDPDIISIVPSLPKSPKHLLLSLFPEYKESQDAVNIGDRDRDSDVSTSKSTFTTDHIKKDVPYINLRVPQQYRLMGYSPEPFPTHGSFIPPGLPRQLKCGAEDELDNIGYIPGVDPIFITSVRPPVAPTPEPKKKPEGSISTNKTRTSSRRVALSNIKDVTIDTLPSSEELPFLPIDPPPSLFEREKIHPHHIFNPTPGVTGFVPMLKNSAVTFEHFLKPLPAFPSAKYPQVRLDPMDVIPGLMKWKQFPNPSLVATEDDKKLATVWKPRWTDPFHTDLLPTRVSAPSEIELLSGVQADDFVDEKSNSILLVPTMEMVRAQFDLPESSTTQQTDDTLVEPPVRDDARLAAIAKLKAEKTELFNQLGEGISQKLKNYQGLLEDNDYKMA